MKMGVSVAGLVAIVVCLGMCVNSQYKPEDYIVKVDPICPAAPEDGPATVTVFTDIPYAKPYATCAGNKDYPLTEASKKGIFTLQAAFDGDSAASCVFYKVMSIKTYKVQVYVPISSLFIYDEAPYKVTCAYAPKGTDQSPEHNYLDNSIVIVDLQGGQVIEDTNIDLYLIDANGDRLTGEITVGKLVAIVGQLKGDASNGSLQAIACKGISGSLEVGMMLGGCGDGNVFPTNTGFTTVGNTATSPFFKTFKISGSSTVSFECTFVSCTDCDGTSCTASSRRRRSSELSQIPEYTRKVDLKPVAETIDEEMVERVRDQEVEYSDITSFKDIIARVRLLLRAQTLLSLFLPMVIFMSLLVVIGLLYIRLTQLTKRLKTKVEDTKKSTKL